MPSVVVLGIGKLEAVFLREGVRLLFGAEVAHEVGNLKADALVVVRVQREDALKHHEGADLVAEFLAAEGVAVHAAQGIAVGERTPYEAELTIAERGNDAGEALGIDLFRFGDFVLVEQDEAEGGAGAGIGLVLGVNLRNHLMKRCNVGRLAAFEVDARQLVLNGLQRFIDFGGFGVFDQDGLGRRRVVSYF